MAFVAHGFWDGFVFRALAGIGWGGTRSLGVPVEVADVDLQILRGGVAVEGLAVAGRLQEPIDDVRAHTGPLVGLSEPVLARKHEHRLLLRALRSMPLHDQIALELYSWEQLTGAEVGQVLGVPENTARTRLRRARLELTRRIDALAEDTAARRSTVDDLERWAASVREALAPDEA